MDRPLKPTEQKFAAEAIKGHFALIRGIVAGVDGSPIAMGADRTYNLFSMEVSEVPDPGNGRHASMYMLPDDYYEYDFAADGEGK